MNTTTLITDIFSISYDKKIFKNLLNYLSLGEIIGQNFLNNKETKFKANIYVLNDPSIKIDDSMENFSGYYKISNKSIYYEKKYGPFTLKLFIDNIDRNEVNFYVNKEYYKYVVVKIDGLYPLGIHITDIFLHKIIQDGNLVIHGASIYNEKSKNGFSLVAPPDTGKTYTTYKFLETEGFKFLGEDLSLWNSKDNNLYCMPFTSTWGHRFNLGSKFKLSSVPFLGLFFADDKKSVYDIFGENKVQKKGKSKIIYLLEKSNDEGIIEKVDNKDISDILRKIKIIQRNEFSYYKNPLILAYDYINKININDTIKKEDELIEKYFQENEIYLVKADNYTKYYNLILKHQNDL